MLKWIEAKGKSERISGAMEDIVKAVSQWLEPVIDEWNQGGRWNYDHCRSKDVNYDCWFFESLKNKKYRGISVRKHNDTVEIHKEVPGILKDTTTPETLLFSFSYYGGYILPYVKYEPIQKLYVDGDFKGDEADKDDTDFFSVFELCCLWTLLDYLFDKEDVDSDYLLEENNLVGNDEEPYNGLKQTYEFDESFFPIGSHVVIHILKEIKTVKEWKPNGVYNGIVSGYLRHYDTNNPTEIQYSEAIVIHAINDNNEVHRFTITTSSIIDGELEIIKVSE